MDVSSSEQRAARATTSGRQWSAYVQPSRNAAAAREYKLACSAASIRPNREGNEAVSTQSPIRSRQEARTSGGNPRLSEAHETARRVRRIAPLADGVKLAKPPSARAHQTAELRPTRSRPSRNRAVTKGHVCGCADEESAAPRLSRGVRARVVWHGAGCLDLTSKPTGFLVTRLWGVRLLLSRTPVGGWAASQYCVRRAGPPRIPDHRPAANLTRLHRSANTMKGAPERRATQGNVRGPMLFQDRLSS